MFCEIVSSKKSWNTFLKHSILDVWQGSGDALWAGWSMIFQLIDKSRKQNDELQISDI